MGNAGNRVVTAVTLLGTTAECQVITAMTWFMETVKQDRHRERSRTTGRKRQAGEEDQADAPSEPLMPLRNPKQNGSHFVAVNCFYVLRLLPQPDFLSIFFMGLLPACEHLPH